MSILTIDNLYIKLFYNISIIIMFSVAFSCCILSPGRRETALSGISFFSLALPLLVVPIFIEKPDYSFTFYVAIAIFMFANIIPIYSGIYKNIKTLHFSLLSIVTGLISSLLLITATEILRLAFSSFLISIIAFGIYAGTVYKKLKSMTIYEGLTPLFISIIGIAVFFINDEQIVLYAGILLFIPALVIFMISLSSHKKHNVVSDNRYDQLKLRFDSEVEKAVKEKTLHLQRAKDIVVEKNKTDELTGALNRRALMATIEDLVLDKRVPKFVMMLFDLDNFKTINDTHGHNVGDQCLKTLASIAKTSLRDYDYFARYGGDEFVIILPNATLREGIIIADRFRKRVSDETFEPNFTLSLGLAAYPWDGDKFKTLNEVADKGLYAAKAKGRNCVQYAGTLKPDSI